MATAWWPRGAPGRWRHTHAPWQSGPRHATPHWIVVTPDLHRIHLSTRVVETNSNFGFAVSWWDRLCGTYRAQPALGQVGMDIGLSDERTPLPLG
jgi:sterol desaturase/sphingolipid hydroxylase (fatty acid hydroxylase superfamily)